MNCGRTLRCGLSLDTSQQRPGIDDVVTSYLGVMSRNDTLIRRTEVGVLNKTAPTRAQVVQSQPLPSADAIDVTNSIRLGNDEFSPPLHAIDTCKLTQLLATRQIKHPGSSEF